MAKSEPKRWFVIVVDDKPIGIVYEGSAQYKQAVRDLSGLRGINIFGARPEDLKRFKQTVKEHEAKRAEAVRKRAERR